MEFFFKSSCGKCSFWHAINKLHNQIEADGDREIAVEVAAAAAATTAMIK